MVATIHDSSRSLRICWPSGVCPSEKRPPPAPFMRKEGDAFSVPSVSAKKLIASVF